MAERRTVSIPELPDGCILGRNVMQEDALRLYWPGSGLDFVFQGTWLEVSLSADYAMFSPWVSIEIDGEWIARMPMPVGRIQVPILTFTDPNVSHRVRIVKDIQPMQDDVRHCLLVTGLLVEGEIRMPDRRNLCLEFVGDSLTTGEGSIGAKMEMDWIPAWNAAFNAFPYMTAKKLNADYRIVSQSGWGIRSAWDNNRRNIVPRIYPEICGPQGNHDPYDFTSRPADAVIINLGTNDSGAFQQPAWQDPESGETFKEQLLEDGTPDPACVRAIVEDQKRFLTLVREKNPKAWILWCLGMIDGPLTDALRDGVEAFAKETGDERVQFVLLPEVAEETMGARQHPGRACHAQTAAVLAAKLEECLSGE